MADIKKTATRQAYCEFLKKYGAEKKDLLENSAHHSDPNTTALIQK